MCSECLPVPHALGHPSATQFLLPVPSSFSQYLSTFPLLPASLSPAECSRVSLSRGPE